MSGLLQRGAERRYSEEDLELIEELAAREARESFWAYRQYMNPRMKRGWWQRRVARELQQFYDDMLLGLRPKLLLEAPPQHGKSNIVTDFICWIAGKQPDWKEIYASFSDDLGVHANSHVQRALSSPRYARVFPETVISSENVVTQAAKPKKNSNLIEYVGKEGSFRNTTVRGQITGKGLDFGVIDDPIKGRQEASSAANRDHAWTWLTDDFFTRFSDHAGFIMMMTRWHLDDPGGRAVLAFPDLRRISYRAIATEDEYDPETGELLRREGEPLFPEHKSLDFLLERRRLLTRSSWESLYQQNPIVAGGEMFPIEQFRILNSAPHRREFAKIVRYWDKAGTEGGGAYTAGVLMGRTRDGRFIVLSVVREQMEFRRREEMIKQTAQLDRTEWGNVTTWIEQEPGSGGKESLERTIANLRGFAAYGDRVTGDKVTRAEPYAAQVQGDNVWLVAAEWNRAFLGEHEAFPNGKYKDLVDSAAGAFAKCAAGSNYASSIMENVR